MLFYKPFVVALAAAAPAFALPAARPASLAARDSPILTPKQQDTTYAMRENVNKWRDQVAQLDPKGQKEAYKELNELAKKLSKYQHPEIKYVEHQNADIFPEFYKLTWDENMAKISMGWWHTWRLKHHIKEVDEEINHDLKHHHARGTNPIETQKNLNAFDALVNEVIQSDEHLSLKPSEEKAFRKEIVESLHDLGLKNKNDWMDKSTKDILLLALQKSNTVFGQLSGDEQAEVISDIQKAQNELSKSKSYN